MSRRRRYPAERAFGRGVGTVLAIIGAWVYWRHDALTLGPGLMATGGLLITLGLLAPAVLFWPNRGWMALAHVLGAISTRLILTVLFFLVITPLGSIRRLLGADPLDRRGTARPSYWTPYPSRHRDRHYYERMF